MRFTRIRGTRYADWSPKGDATARRGVSGGIPLSGIQTADPLSVPSAGISPCLRWIVAAEEWPAGQAEEARCEGSSSSPLVHSCSRDCRGRSCSVLVHANEDILPASRASRSRHASITRARILLSNRSAREIKRVEKKLGPAETSGRARDNGEFT